MNSGAQRLEQPEEWLRIFVSVALEYNDKIGGLKSLNLGHSHQMCVWVSLCVSYLQLLDRDSGIIYFLYWLISAVTT